MRYALLGDIHGNVEALTACLASIDAQAIDQIICLGDIAGYGAEPAQCLEIIRERGCDTIAGNHDWAATGRLSVDCFSLYARRAAMWSREQLSQEQKNWIDRLPLTLAYDDFVVAHGTFHNPEAFNYIQTIGDAEKSFAALKLRSACLGFLGHSHVPVAFFCTDPISYSLDQVIPTEPELTTIVNAGSVGQPRDQDNRASYAIFDSADRLVTINRVTYDIAGAAARIAGAGLPKILGERLFEGK